MEYDNDDNSDLIFMIAVLGLFICIPVILAFSIPCCIAASRTRKWKKEKARRQNTDPENESESSLLKKSTQDEDTDSELDPEDSDDEAEIKAREEERLDWTLTPKQKFRKELRTVWKGSANMVDAQQKKEREDRKKLAKAVAKEMFKMQRRQERRSARGSNGYGSKEKLPTYNKATKVDEN